jgi:nitrogen regulatory protein PII
MAKAKRRTIHCDLILTHVEALTLRDVAGEGAQAELLIRTRTGTLAVRLIARRGIALRFTDLRARDRKQRAKQMLVPVTFDDVGMRA